MEIIPNNSDNLKKRRIDAQKIVKFIIKLVSVVFKLILVLIFSCLLFSVIFYLDQSRNPKSIWYKHQSDEKFIANYFKFKDEFEELEKLIISENDITSIDPDTSSCRISYQKEISSADSISCAKYIQLFQTLGLDWVYSFQSADEKQFWFEVSTRGLTAGGSTKGYYYSAQGLPSYKHVLTENTDKARGGYAFHHIEGNWYIYLEK